MPQFVLDHGSPEGSKAFAALDSFTQGYVECLFFTECHADNPELEHASFAELAPETLARIVEDCRDFQTSFAELLERAFEFDHYDESRAGHDFWLTRNGHGAGFWDRGLGAIGQRLTEMSKPFGSCDLYRGDNDRLYLGIIYFSPLTSVRE